MIKKKYFGTDGIRGQVGESLINPEFVLKLGWAAGKVLSSHHTSQVLIGKDTRISGYLLESVLEAGLSAAGVNALMLGPMPTPAVAYLTRTLRTQAGIVISASHNPYQDNGIKFFSPLGMKLSDEIELAIEAQLDKPMQMVSAAKLGKARRVDDAPGRYIEFCKSTLGLNRSLKGLKIVIDCSHGATYQIAPAVLQELGAEIIELGTDPDGFNINDNCGSTHPKMLRTVVVAEEADCGIAFDGDGDRVIMVDNKGEIVDGDELLFIMVKNSLKNRKLQGGVVGTLMSNCGLEVGLRKLGLDFVRAKVGDRYVLEALQANNWLIGGESSGHIIHLGITTTGDGIISALQVLDAMCTCGKTLHELKSEMTKFPQVLINVKCAKLANVKDEPKIKSAVQKVEKQLGSSGRVLLRASGTEPLIRVMVEGEDLAQITVLAEDLVNVVKACVV